MIPLLRSSLLFSALLCAFFAASGDARADLKFPLDVSTATGPAEVKATAVGADGSIYIAGEFQGTLTLGGTTLTASNQDIFVAKIDATGNYLWAVKAGGAGTENFFDLAVDSVGAAYVVGNYDQAASFGSIQVPYGGSADPDLFAARVSSTGIWSWVYHRTSVAVYLADIAVSDLDGGVYITRTGIFESGGIPQLEKLDSNGTLVWSRSFPGTLNSLSVGVQYTDQGPPVGVVGKTVIYVVGNCDGGCTVEGVGLPGSPLYVVRFEQGASDPTPVKASGWPKWGTAAIWDGPVAHSAIDADLNLYVSGRYLGTPAFSPWTGPAAAGFGEALAVAKLSPGGVWEWLAVSRNPAFGSTYTYGIPRLSTDTQGSVYVDTAIASTLTSTGREELWHYKSSTSQYVFSGIGFDLPDSSTSQGMVARLTAADGQWQWAAKVAEVNPQPTVQNKRNLKANAIATTPGGLTIAGGYAQSTGTAQFYNAIEPNEVLDPNNPAQTLTLLNARNGWLHALTPQGDWLQQRNWIVGQEIPRPSGTVALQPDITLSSGGSGSDYFFWSPATNKLYATQSTGFATIGWKLSSDPLNTTRFSEYGTVAWPNNPRLHVAGTPADVDPTGLAPSFLGVMNTQSAAVVDVNKVFHATGTGYSVLFYTNGPTGNPATEAPLFSVVLTRAWNDPSLFTDHGACTIGTKLTDPAHSDPLGKNGYVYFENSRYDGSGTDAAYDRATRQGTILPVNEDTSSPTDDMVVVWYTRSAPSDPNSLDWVAWPGRSVRYDCHWPDPNAPGALKIVIASGEGSELPGQPALDFSHPPYPRIYNQPDKNLPGFNPNEEQALILEEVAYALRDDLDGSLQGHAVTSKPYVLVKYVDEKGTPGAADDEWAMRVYRVAAEEAPYSFNGLTATAGTVLQPPFPLSTLAPCTQTSGAGEPLYLDHNGVSWARSAGSVTVKYYYPMLAGFWYDVSGDGVNDANTGDCLPWLDYRSGTPGTPINVAFNVAWPATAPTLRVGETLLRAKNGLPNILPQQAAKIAYDQSNPTGSNPAQHLAALFDPLSSRQVPRFGLPGTVASEVAGGVRVITGTVDGSQTLSTSLQKRLYYDDTSHQLCFKGILDEATAGDSLLLPNVMTASERDAILALAPDPDWSDDVTALYWLSRNPNQLDLDHNGTPDDAYLVGLALADPNNLASAVGPQSLVGANLPKALTAGVATGTGYLTLAFNDDPSIVAPVSLSVLRVDCPVYTGQIQVLEPSNVFDEHVTLRHSGDFAGLVDGLTFQWWVKFSTDTGAVPDPNTAVPPTPWVSWAEGQGLNEITLGGPNVRTLSDNHFIVRYTGFPGCGNVSAPSDWAGAPGSTPSNRVPQLAEGWVKRVLAGLNPFDQRTRDFHQNAVATYVSMLRQAGPRYEGDVALNSDGSNVNSIGLIEAYETVLRRAKSLSIDGSPPITDFEPANQALLLVASKLADLYMLLGNEAYSDAADPSIGLTTSSSYGTLAPSIFAFENQLPSLLEEELALLRGRDDTNGPTGAAPVYNRLFWNFTTGEGEVAYQQVYNIGDENGDGSIDEQDARLLYPQGHGDAWGHYLTALGYYYGLLTHPNYGWTPRTEEVLVAGVPIEVDFLDERKFARAAAALARTGAQIVDLTYSQSYTEDPSGQWQGYKDSDPNRAWGLDEWARRAGQGAYFNWLAGNGLLPDVDTDPTHTGIRKVDRATVTELGEIAAEFDAIQSKLDEADKGLNPLGLAKGVVPFDIDPALIDSNLTHFEQIYDRALVALDNAVAVFDFANQQTQSLRRNQDTVDDFRSNTIDQELDYHNRLIELFGYPYSDDIGPTGTYPEGYDGPDLYHYMYVDRSELTGAGAPAIYDPNAPGPSDVTAFFSALATGAFFDCAAKDSFGGNHHVGCELDDPLGGPAGNVIKPVVYHVSVDGFGYEKPDSWTGSRQAPGDIQLALSDVYQARAAYERAEQHYQNVIADIQTSADLLQAQYDLSTLQVSVYDSVSHETAPLALTVTIARATGSYFQWRADQQRRYGEIAAECFPTVVGLANDLTSSGRCGVRLAGQVSAEALEWGVWGANAVAGAAQAAIQTIQSQAERRILVADQRHEVQLAAADLETKLREETEARLESLAQLERFHQTEGQYQQKLARGFRTLEELVAFRKKTAAQIQQYRYDDLSFRVMRNDALQKFRAAFDLAARYAYLAASAYDYETNLLGGEGAAGQNFLTDIVRYRSLGEVRHTSGGLSQPIAGSNGLADPLARMKQNFDVLKGQLGFNNPQTETNRFSLRGELFRLRDDSDARWSKTLEGYRVANLWDVPEFRRFCRPFTTEDLGPQPGLVIPFSTEVVFGRNFFGRSLGGGDSAYDPTYFATKVRSVGVWFTNYNSTGLSNTPRVYLVPVGADVLRSPTSDGFEFREWRVVDQVLPTPFQVGSLNLSDPDWIPQNDSLGNNLAAIRRFSSFRAYHDSGGFNPSETITASRLIGRSVWNTRWLLIIPGGTLLADPDAGLDTFIHGLAGAEDGVTDIKIFFQTYAYSGVRRR